MQRALLLIIVWLVSVASVTADERTSLWPAIPEATGDPHPEGNEYMRRMHMEMMKHDRDLTMYDGERPVHASLKSCFDCHEVKDEQNVSLTYADERHFCRVCHDYAAVKVDCFSCHRSTPDGVDEAPAHALYQRPRQDGAGIVAWLRGLSGGTADMVASTGEIQK